MPPFKLFKKVNQEIKYKTENNEDGLYIYILFPIAFIFLLTFMGARIISHINPDLHIPWWGVHVHHYAYGFFILAAAGYLSLVFSGPRAKYWIAMLHGFGLGLSFDEFGIWLHLSDDDLARWSYDGFLIIIGLIVLILSAKRGIRFIKNFIPFT
ncbi:MAG TPA: hypothetical protein VJH67_03790 [Candidatus Paceibacterota bacterium]